MCYFCTVNKRLDLVAPIFAHICNLTCYLCLPILIQIVNVIDLRFKGKKFELVTLGSSNMIISQKVTDRANIAIANKWKVAKGFFKTYLYLTLIHSKGEGQGHAHFDCAFFANGDR